MRKYLALLTVMQLLIGSCLLAQQRTITGKVLNQESGNPITGVTVKVLGTATGTITDNGGMYKITVPNAKGKVLLFMHVGMATGQFTIRDSSIVNISLSPAGANTLNDVVVTAYGQTRNRRELSYNAQEIKGDDIAQTHRDNFINGLAGRVPGLTVTSTSGVPGASSQIFLRTPVSMSGNNQPLFVIDGLPVSNQTFSAGNLISGPQSNSQSDYTNRIADINPNDIDKITILKGPEASALYGSDGASGAIIITTKSGKSNKTVVTYDNSFRWDKIYKYPTVQNRFGIGQRGIYDPTAYNANSYSGGGYYMFGAEIPASEPTYDNIKKFFRTGTSTQHNLSIESGNYSTLTYRLSASYLKTDGVVPATSYTRYNFRLSASAHVSSTITATGSASFVSSDNKKAPKGAGGYYTNLMNWPANYNLDNYLTSTGSRLLLLPQATPSTPNYGGEIDNPFWNIYKNPAEDKTDRFIGNIKLQFKPYQWWSMTGALGFDQYNTIGTYAYHPRSKVGYASNGYYGSYTDNFKNSSGTFSSVMDKTFGEISNTLNLTAYFENSKEVIFNQTGSNFYEADFTSINNTDPTTQRTQSVLPNSRKLRFLANYTIGYKKLLYLTGSGTYEGNSTLSSTVYNKTPFFKYGSVAGSFIFSDIKGVKDRLPWLSFGKLRGGLGTTGKGPYSPYIIDNDFINTTVGGFVYSSTRGNINLKPEYTTTYEAGAELKFLHNKLGLDITYYRTNTKDQINLVSVPYSSGFIQSWINGGKITSNGLEIQLTATAVSSKNFEWNITSNFNKSKGHVVSMPDNVPYLKDGASNVFGNVMGYYKKDFPIGGMVGSLLSRNKDGQVLISTATGLPVTTSSTDSLIGNRMPDFTIGIINSFTIAQSWNLSFNIDIRKGGDVFNANKMYMIQMGVSPLTLDRNRPRVIPGVLSDGLENSSTPTANNIAIIPNNTVTSGNLLGNAFYSSAYAEKDFVEKVNWLRMRDITLSYLLPKSLIGKQSIVKSGSVFVTATDLFMITNYSGLDPSANATNASAKGYGAQGMDFGSIPTPRSFNIGIKATF